MKKKYIRVIWKNITAEIIFTDDKKIEINKTDKVRSKFKVVKVAGAIVGTSGLLFTSLRTSVFIFALNDDGLNFTDAFFKTFF